MSEVKYPKIKVKLTGRDGNAYSVVGAVVTALQRAGVPAVEISAYQEDSFSGDYNHLLATAMKWVQVS